jgi:tyrosine-protein phosphatase OCA6
MALQRQLIPPFRYAIVEDSFFRGAYPTIKNFRFLRRLHLKTLVSLTPEAHPNRDMKEFCEHEGIAVHNFFVDKFQGDGVTLTSAKVIQVLQIIIRPENLPVYLHCLDGTHVTGVVVMCFRKLQSWNLSTSTAEFCQFEKDGEISREESQFVESFRGEFEVPPVIPKWLWQGIRTVKHPSFRLRLLPAPDGSDAPASGHGDQKNPSATLTSKPRYHPSGADNPMDSHAANNQGMESQAASQAAGLGRSLAAPIGMMEGTVIYGDGESGRRQSGSRILHMGVWLGTDPTGVDEIVNKRGGVVVKTPPILALDRTERWSGPQAIVGFPRKGFREVHDSESRRSLEALSLEGVDVMGSRRAPGWPRQVRRPRSIVGTTSSKSTSSREQELPQFISTRR